jgi:hypothetical protein
VAQPKSRSGPFAGNSSLRDAECYQSLFEGKTGKKLEFDDAALAFILLTFLASGLDPHSQLQRATIAAA